MKVILLLSAYYCLHYFVLGAIHLLHMRQVGWDYWDYCLTLIDEGGGVVFCWVPAYTTINVLTDVSLCCWLILYFSPTRLFFWMWLIDVVLEDLLYIFVVFKYFYKIVEYTFCLALYYAFKNKQICYKVFVWFKYFYEIDFTIKLM